MTFLNWFRVIVGSIAFLETMSDIRKYIKERNPYGFIRGIFMWFLMAVLISNNWE